MRTARDEADGFAAVEMETGGQVRPAVEPDALDFEAGAAGGRGQYVVIEEVDGPGHLAQLPVGGECAEFRDPPRPFHGCLQAAVVFREEGGKGLLIRSSGLNEELCAGAEPAGQFAKAEVELIACKEMEDVGGVDSSEAGEIEGDLAREPAGADGEPRPGGIVQAACQNREVGGVEVVGDDIASSVKGGERGRSIGSAEVEGGRGCIAAAAGGILDEQLAQGAELFRSPAHAVAGEAAAVHNSGAA